MRKIASLENSPDHRLKLPVCAQYSFSNYLFIYSVYLWYNCIFLYIFNILFIYYFYKRNKREEIHLVQSNKETPLLAHNQPLHIAKTKKQKNKKNKKKKKKKKKKQAHTLFNIHSLIDTQLHTQIKYTLNDIAAAAPPTLEAQRYHCVRLKEAHSLCTSIIWRLPHTQGSHAKKPHTHSLAFSSLRHTHHLHISLTILCIRDREIISFTQYLRIFTPQLSSRLFG